MTKVSVAFGIIIVIWIKMLNQLSFTFRRIITLDVVARFCMVVDWCIDHPEYTAKIKVIPKKDYPVMMPCEF